MSWFAVRDEDGKYWDFEGMDDYRKPLSATDRGRKWAEEAKANTGGSEIIEVVEKTAPIAVSEAEADMLEQAKCDDDPAELIVGFVNSRDNYDDDSKAEDRLMRAYVNGYTVAKEKKYNVKVPYAYDSYFYKVDDDRCDAASSLGAGLSHNRSRFTESEIEHYGLQDCEKEEVTDDDD
ncbi:DUF1642 domain-containing protein [Lacticaseibacillus zhaodongensis]|uniref:DUF1642 domain-containing protein n=1 Tax=Lacticaseibacillus zhaodongensis TaxID=2668065 RepID=UPI0012D34271|nr:DUF1642 domain-containing protein [Lacticaseibacillus zhaodongensis]